MSRHNCLDAPKRNSSGDADASKVSEATQAFGNHSEVYDLENFISSKFKACPTLFLLLVGTQFFLFTPGLRLDAPKRNCNGNADAYKGSEATQAFRNHSEVYNSENLIERRYKFKACPTLFLLLMGVHIFSFHSRLSPGFSET